MRDCLKFYINGEWVTARETGTLTVTNPATGQAAGRIALGTAADVDQAVGAARVAFGSWSMSSREERIEVLERLIAEYRRRTAEIAAAITEEMGAPIGLSYRA